MSVLKRLHGSSQGMSVSSDATGVSVPVIRREALAEIIVRA